MKLITGLSASAGRVYLLRPVITVTRESLCENTITLLSSSRCAGVSRSHTAHVRIRCFVFYIGLASFAPRCPLGNCSKISRKLLGLDDWGLTLSRTIIQSYWAGLVMTVEKCWAAPVRIYHWLKLSSYWPRWKEWTHSGGGPGKWSWELGRGSIWCLPLAGYS